MIEEHGHWGQTALGQIWLCGLLAMRSLAVIYFCISKHPQAIKWRRWNLLARLTAMIKHTHSTQGKCLVGSEYSIMFKFFSKLAYANMFFLPELFFFSMWASASTHPSGFSLDISSSAAILRPQSLRKPPTVHAQSTLCSLCSQHHSGHHRSRLHEGRD